MSWEKSPSQVLAGEKARLLCGKVAGGDSGSRREREIAASQVRRAKSGWDV